MKKTYIVPQNNVVSSRIRTSILAGSNSFQPGNIVNNFKKDENTQSSVQLANRRISNID